MIADLRNRHFYKLSNGGAAYNKVTKILTAGKDYTRVTKQTDEVSACYWVYML